MLEQLSNAITFYAFYVESKTGKTGLTVTVDVWEVTTAGVATEIVSAGSATEIGDGLYRYILASGSVDAEGEYVAVFKTATSSVDQQHLPAIWAIQRAGVENLDEALSTIDGNVDAVLVDTGTTLPATLSTIEGKIDTVDTNVDAVLADTGTDGVVLADGAITAAKIADNAIDAGAIAANAITAAKIATGAIDADALAADAVDEIWDEVVEGTYTVRQMLRLMASALFGKASGGGTTTVTFRDTSDGTNRIVATVDSSGNRSAVTLDVT